jgi:hypothetical protein
MNAMPSTLSAWYPQERLWPAYTAPLACNPAISLAL